MITGGAVSWSSKLQGVVTLSTTEAEYIAAVDAGKDTIWMRNLLTEVGIMPKYATKLNIDNQSAISVSKNPEHHGRMIHLDLRFYWLRDTVHAKYLEPTFVPTADKTADVFTKPLARPDVMRCRKMLGVLSSED